MPRTRKPIPGQPTEPPLEDDVFRVVLTAPSPEVFAGLLRKTVLDVGPLEQNPKTGELIVTLYATQAQAEALRAEGWKLVVHENMSEIGRQRQQEVARGDRFEGGRVAPKGLGQKIRGEG